MFRSLWEDLSYVEDILIALVENDVATLLVDGGVHAESGVNIFETKVCKICRGFFSRRCLICA